MSIANEETLKKNFREELDSYFQSLQTPFVVSYSLPIVFCVLFVDAVICEMDEFIAHIFLAQRKFFSSKSDQPILVNVKSERVHTGQRHVDPQIELEAVDEEGIGDVLTHEYVRDFLVENHLDIICDVNSLALRGSIRLANVKFLAVALAF